MRKLARLMPSASSIGLPRSAKKIRISQAITQDRIAIDRRSAAVAARVRLAKIGAQPGGSTITRKVTRTEPKSSITA